MRKSIRTPRGVIATIAAFGVLAMGVVGGVAIADDSPVKAQAPHARASALVNENGTRKQSQGIKAINKPGAGVYCVTFDDAAKIDVARSTPVATMAPETHGKPWGHTVVLSTAPSASCGSAADTLTVYTGNSQYGLHDYAFFLVVP
ncbi:hypothetical protein ABT381_18760 [Streptomyces sp. NPDC000151]|uniref:hypothetical protein n=1 Tax=Streptomyces sp. NPDC000151 TaxID=3154244 RepID=UPI00331AFEC7